MTSTQYQAWALSSGKEAGDTGQAHAVRDIHSSRLGEGKAVADEPEVDEPEVDEPSGGSVTQMPSRQG